MCGGRKDVNFKEMSLKNRGFGVEKDILIVCGDASKWKEVW